MRDRLGITARALKRFGHSTGRLDARLYDDSWEIKAFSSDARVLFDVGQHFQVGPHLRYYVQSAANFWRLAYVGSATSVPAYRAGDRELGPLMNLTAGGSARWALNETWALGATFDGTYAHYFADLYITRMWSGLETITVEATW